MTSAPQFTLPPLTLDGLLDVMKQIRTPPPLPKLFAGDPCDKVLDALGVHKVPGPFERWASNHYEMAIVTDPFMPANTIRFEHPDGRIDVLVLQEDGSVANIPVPSSPFTEVK